MIKLFATSPVIFAAALALSTSNAQAQPESQVAREPPPPTSMTSAGVALWRSAYVDEHNVVPVGASDKGVEYGMGGSFSITPAATVKGWMRWEQFAPTVVGGEPTRSFTQLVEVDCQGGRGRLLALDLYPYNNLQGEARHVDAQSAEWTYARPGTVLEQNVKVMCGAATSMVRQAVAQAAAAQSGGQDAGPAVAQTAALNASTR